MKINPSFFSGNYVFHDTKDTKKIVNTLIDIVNL